MFVDEPRWPAHGMLWSHLASDASLEELHEFAASLGIPRRGFDLDHYDIPAHRYHAAIDAGAEPVSIRQFVLRLRTSGLRVPQHRRAAETTPHG